MSASLFLAAPGRALLREWEAREAFKRRKQEVWCLVIIMNVYLPEWLKLYCSRKCYKAYVFQKTQNTREITSLEAKSLKGYELRIPQLGPGKHILKHQHIKKGKPRLVETECIA